MAAAHGTERGLLQLRQAGEWPAAQRRQRFSQPHGFDDMTGRGIHALIAQHGCRLRQPMGAHLRWRQPGLARRPQVVVPTRRGNARAVPAGLRSGGHRSTAPRWHRRRPRASWPATPRPPPRDSDARRPTPGRATRHRQRRCGESHLPPRRGGCAVAWPPRAASSQPVLGGVHPFRRTSISSSRRTHLGRHLQRAANSSARLRRLLDGNIPPRFIVVVPAAAASWLNGQSAGMVAA
jgi:hypothetical protein